MTTAYCVQRADLVSYQRILTVWRDAAGGERQARHRPLAGGASRNQADTKAVLNILVSCR
jgi:hypothetical protein